MLDFRAGWRGIRVKRTFRGRGRGRGGVEAGPGSWSPGSPTLPRGISSNGPSCFGRTCEVLVGRNCYRFCSQNQSLLPVKVEKFKKCSTVLGSYRLRESREPSDLTRLNFF